MEKRFNEKVVAIILAGGSGSRMCSDITKQRMQILGKTVLYRSVMAFEKCSLVDEVILVVKEDEVDFAKAEAVNFNKVKKIVKGGSCRAESSKCGFLAVDDDNSILLIHDAARCMITQSDIEKVIYDTAEYGCATASYPVSDTIKRTDADGRIEKTVKRESLRAVQTPQGCYYKLYEKAISLCSDLSSVTDDNMLLEGAGYKPFCSDTSKENIKITTMTDIDYAEFLLSWHRNKN